MRNTSLVLLILFAISGCSSTGSPYGESGISNPPLEGEQPVAVELRKDLAAKQDDGHVIEIYDVRDIVQEIRDYPAPGDKIKPSTVRKFRVGDHLVPLLRSILSPVAKVNLKSRLLTVRATKEEHATVRGLLNLIRKRLGSLVSLTVRILESTRDLSGKKIKSKVGGAIRLTGKDLKSLLEDVKKDKNTKMISVPRLTTFNGQNSHIMMSNQVSYIKSFEVMISAGGAGVADPVIGVLTTGLSIGMRPVIVSEKEGKIRLKDAKLVLSKLKKFRNIKTPYGVIQDPEVLSFTFRLNVTLRKGEAVLVGPFSKPFAKKDAPKVWMILTAEVVNLAEPKDSKDD